MTFLNTILPLLIAIGIGGGSDYRCCAFAPPPPIRQQQVIPQFHDGHQYYSHHIIQQHQSPFTSPPSTQSTTTSTTLYTNGVIIDVPDNFFTATFFSIGLFYSLGKAYNRYLLEEVAFEQRRYEARERALADDPTLNEYDLRRGESAQWLSVYGRKFRGRGETTIENELNNSDGGGGGEEDGRRRKSRRVATLDRDDDDDDDDQYSSQMSDDEISNFESTYGVQYDPYYDEPYAEDELPAGKYKEDKSYGDRRYENGEVFYKDEGSGLFYRQGSKPRQKKFWDLNSS